MGQRRWAFADVTQETTHASRQVAQGVQPIRARPRARILLSRDFQSSYFIGIIGYATYALGAGTDLVSLLTLAYNAATFLGSIAAGILIDRRGPRQVLLASLAGGICLASFAWAVPLSPLMLMMSSSLASRGVSRVGRCRASPPTSRRRASASSS